MAINRIGSSKSLSIEVQSGTDAKGAATYAKKSFANLRNDIAEQNAYDVAEAIKVVLAEPTRSYFINTTAQLMNA